MFVLLRFLFLGIHAWMGDRSCAASADSDAVADDDVTANAGVFTASPGDSSPCWVTLSCFVVRRTSLVRGVARTMCVVNTA